MAAKPILIIHLDAGHDPNDNPRRVYVVFDSDGGILEAIDEGYEGRGAIRKYKGVPEGGTFATSVKEYRELLQRKPRSGNPIDRKALIDEIDSRGLAYESPHGEHIYIFGSEPKLKSLRGYIEKTWRVFPSIETRNAEAPRLFIHSGAMRPQEEETHRNTMSMADFVENAGITMTCEWVASRPDKLMSDPRHPMDHWKCILRKGKRRMTVYFSMGSAYKGREPTVEEVLSNLRSDFTTLESSMGFEDWAENFGYDPSSREAREAKKLYTALSRQRDQLDALLDDDEYDYRALIDEVEND